MNIENYEYLKSSLPLAHEGMKKMIAEGMKWGDWANDLQVLMTDLVSYFGEKEGICLDFLENVKALAQMGREGASIAGKTSKFLDAPRTRSPHLLSSSVLCVPSMGTL